MKTIIIGFATLMTLGACATAAGEGEVCTSDADCAEGLECHMEDHDDHADESEEEHEESGVCESHEDDHDDTAHDDTAHEEM